MLLSRGSVRCRTDCGGQAPTRINGIRIRGCEQALTEYNTLAADLNQDTPSEDALLLEARSRVGLLQAATNRPEEALATFVSI